MKKVFIIASICLVSACNQHTRQSWVDPNTPTTQSNDEQIEIVENYCKAGGLLPEDLEWARCLSTTEATIKIRAEKCDALWWKGFLQGGVIGANYEWSKEDCF